MNLGDILQGIDQWRAAIDEAGHAVMARLQYLPVRIVTIDPDRCRSGQGGFTEIGYPTPLTDQARSMRLRTSVAGVAGLRVMGFDRPDDIFQRDVDWAIKDLAQAYEAEGRSQEQANDLAEQFVGNVITEVEQLLALQKQALEVLAQYLNSNLTIEGEETSGVIDRIIASTNGAGGTIPDQAGA